MYRALKIIFAGTPEFAVTTLKALLDSQHEVMAVYTQPDRPAGRGRKLTASAVKILALQHELPVMQPVSLKDVEAQQQLADWDADIMVVVAYGLMLPEAVLIAPRLGCVNVHASLLPRWRGAAPIQRAILAGDLQTGVTIMQMNAGLDTGDMLHIAHCPIEANDTAQSLHDRLAQLGAEALLQSLSTFLSGDVQPQPQDDSQSCYAHKLQKSEAQFDWALSANNLQRSVRAFNPWPIAFTLFEHEGQQKNLRIWSAESLSETSNEPPGTVLSESKQGIDVATGEGILRLKQLQLPGGKTLTAEQFLNAHSLMGACLG